MFHLPFELYLLPIFDVWYFAGEETHTFQIMFGSQNAIFIMVKIAHTGGCERTYFIIIGYLHKILIEATLLSLSSRS